MTDVGRCLADGYSTAGLARERPGGDRPARGRFDIHSEPGDGHGPAGLASMRSAASREVCRRRAKSGRGQRSRARRGGLRRRLGDASSATAGASSWWSTGWATGLRPPRRPRRRCASSAAHALAGPAEIIEASHAALRGTRGAALAIARLDHDRGEVRYAASATSPASSSTPRTGATTSMVSHNGTVGHTIRKVQDLRLSLDRGLAAGHAFRRPGHALAPRPLPGLVAAAPEPHRRGPLPRLQARTRRRDGLGGADRGGRSAP